MTFFEQEQMKTWPFKIPEISRAVDGWTCKPKTWGSGSGSYGCCQSHLNVLRKAMEDRIESILVLEDDAQLAPNFLEKSLDFLTRVPEDWEILMLGGQHRNGWPPEVAPGIRRCQNCQRTHAYAVRGQCLSDLYHLWNSMTSGHIDHWMGPWAADRLTYAPDPFLFGQAAGKSDITCKEHELRFWSNVKGLNPAMPEKPPRKHIRLKDTYDAQAEIEDEAFAALAPAR